MPKDLLYRLALSISVDKSEQRSDNENIKTLGFKNSDVEVSGESFCPGESVASAPSFEVQRENEDKVPGLGPLLKGLQQVVDLRMSSRFTSS